jgi:hypothetical protein
MRRKKGYKMKNNSKILEKFLYEIWKEQNFIKELRTNDGQQIKVVDVGTENKEVGGPDFKNARIKIGNITYLGDIEIDSYYNDWKSHGHNINKKYNSVVLHATMNNEPHKGFVYTSDGRKVQSISLHSFLKNDLGTTLQRAILSERKNRINKMPCQIINQEVSEKEKLNFVYDLGLKRFKGKCDKMLDRLKELIYLKELNLKEPIVKYELDEKFFNKTYIQKDFSNLVIWQQLIYEYVFEALGYSKNKEIMRSLAQSVDIRFFESLKIKEDFKFVIESALFNVSGLMPDVQNLPDEETSSYTKKLNEIWNSIKGQYDGKIYNAVQWHFFKLRPQNFPTIRIAGGARILNKILGESLIPNLIDKIEKTSNINNLTNSLRSLFIIKGEGFWHDHYVFDQPARVPINYFIGASRADEILVNIILPIISIYFEIFDRKELSQRAIKVYLNFYQKSENNLVNEVSSTLFLNDAWKRSVLYQGMIELFRNFCSREKCLECDIGKKVFS